MNGRRGSPSATLAVLAFAALAFSLTQTALIPAISAIARTFGTSSDTATLTLSVYFLSGAICIPVIGRLGDLFGKRRVLLVVLAFLVVGAVISAEAQSVAVVIAGRAVQGVASGIFPLCFGIVRDELPEHRRPGAIGLVAALATIGGGLGLVLGGYLIDAESFRSIFWVTALLAVIAGVLVIMVVPTSPRLAIGRVDWLGAVTLGIALFVPLFGVVRAGSGWLRPRTLVLLVGGVILVAVWWWVQRRRTTRPLIDVEMQMRRPLVLTSIATFFVSAGMFGIFFLVPQVAEAPASSGYGFGLDALHAGLLLLPGALLSLLCAPLSGKLTIRLGSRFPLVVGAALASVALALLGLWHHSPTQVAILATFLFMGNALAFAAMPNLVMDAVRQDETGEATGVNVLVRSVGSSLGSQITATILAAGAHGSGLTTDGALTHVFVLAAAVAALAALIACVIPRASLALGGTLTGALPSLESQL